MYGTSGAGFGSEHGSSASEVLIDDLLRRSGAPPKPSLTEIELIRAALAKPILTPLTEDEKELLYKFRYALVDDSHALSKFLHAVNWRNIEHEAQAVRLLTRWAPLKTPQALELLMGTLKNPYKNEYIIDKYTSQESQRRAQEVDHAFADIRGYAVSQLAHATDAEVLTYLLMLVQALRYENNHECPLANFLISRATTNIELCTAFNWYLRVEVEKDYERLKDRKGLDLEAEKSSIFEAVYERFQTHLSTKPECAALHASIKQQHELLKRLSELFNGTKSAGKSEKKTQKLFDLLNAPTGLSILKSPDVPSTTLPSLPTVEVGEIIPERCLVFKSAMAPQLLAFQIRNTSSSILDVDPTPFDGTSPSSSSLTSLSSSLTPSSTLLSARNFPSKPATIHTHSGRQIPKKGSTYRVIYKEGDDLRQDQLVVQLISLMDHLLKQRNMDLRLTPYKVLATGPLAGFVEFISNSSTLTKIQEEDREIANFIQKHNPGASLATAMNNYTYSLAGYCVLTYILAVGDRHLENIMLTTDGHLVHIDFGWCFGFDPKPSPPLIRVTKDMMAALGSENSTAQETFRRALCDTFIVLRRNANLILTLLMLMRDAKIPHLNNQKIILSIQDRFLLHLNDDAACMELLKLFHASANAILPLVTDKIHNWVSNWR